MVQWVMNPTSVHEDMGPIPASLNGLLWRGQWHRLAAPALTGSLAWELPYAVGAALKRYKYFCQVWFVKLL